MSLEREYENNKLTRGWVEYKDKYKDTHFQSENWEGEMRERKRRKNRQVRFL